ncbi:CpaF family protein [Paenibacillus alvei]|uniref:CpaF family protein n=1 Tax=Paenibacillus alvei TaxID=44250 RepID=UPI00227ECBFA|nr:ATPase, T2SS/T4P/T4SS family [Paenibacillus alvei]
MFRSRTYSLVNFGGGSPLTLLTNLLKSFPKHTKSIIVEFPCLGIPKVSYAFNQVRISKEHTIDQLILDYDRNEKKAIEDYIVTTEEVDYLIVNPRALPEIPTIRKINSNKTLIDLPLYVKLQLQDKYDFVLFILQGTLVNPMTHFAIRCSDHIVLHSNDGLEFVSNYTNHKKLNDIFGIEKDRMFLYSEDTNFKFEEEKVYTRITELTKHIHERERFVVEFVSDANEAKLNNESLGIINPLDFLDYEFQPLDVATEISQNDIDNMNELSKSVRSYLRDHHVDDFINSMMQKEARLKVCYFIADWIRENNRFSFSMNINDVIEWIQKDITGLGPLQDILDDPDITNIDINGPDKVIVECKGVTIHRKDIRFQSLAHMYQIIDKMLMGLGKPLTASECIIDANYKGFRVNVIADTKSRNGVSAGFPLISIRKFPPRVFTDEECIKYGNISQEISDFLQFIVPCEANIVIAGSTNSGKTTQLIRLPLYVDPLTRIMSIEDSEEMMLASKEQYKDYPNLPSLLVKHTGEEDTSYGIDKLVKASLRQNPDILAIGEIRDAPSAKQSLIGMNTGHVVWKSLHANSARDAAIRLLQLNDNTEAAASQVSSSIDIIIFQKRLKNGVRVVTEISELLGYIGTKKPILNPIFKYDYKKQKHVKVGSIVSESLHEKIELNGCGEDEFYKWCEIKPHEEAAS